MAPQSVDEKVTVASEGELIDHASNKAWCGSSTASCMQNNTTYLDEKAPDRYPDADQSLDPLLAHVGGDARNSSSSPDNSKQMGEELDTLYYASINPGKPTTKTSGSSPSRVSTSHNYPNGGDSGSKRNGITKQ